MTVAATIDGWGIGCRLRGARRGATRWPAASRPGLPPRCLPRQHSQANPGTMRHIRRRWLVLSRPRSWSLSPPVQPCLPQDASLGTRWQFGAQLASYCHPSARCPETQSKGGTACCWHATESLRQWSLLKHARPCPGSPASVVLPQRPAVKMRHNSPRKIDVVPGSIRDPDQASDQSGRPDLNRRPLDPQSHPEHRRTLPNRAHWALEQPEQWLNVGGRCRVSVHIGS
jgi:hypothetical protein